ncbi:hypothetical protein PPROV_000439100 [Pycnococcus provasolii]|uniref:Uncharacterized protein n=1 Tax=Pycnococcus provasolii TaxID=41880 RepID=A0A830HJ94_9CHLO|nr:hypothetical protein PPROV_000439100 [Pycnococcus provasolii]|mmetsp:Transcript_8160/g.18690  ORF Transcript_8160/g.18690 Transcript_8160/m.18690 type:complete len:151 (+) Transcript_8160:459-911(+)|eukprot:CAMPEP_0206130626 /NCGR_PEP_ID=MMETSP1472-20131121/41896_1 /ASSEMBLY_ACC=CAM_ASM_001108 /TAXON_ID=41880 /ORGANISM="Pycnococcus provasolii, Strain RCC251" /LENGTH=150 /DNA_ID=CAMNT_0053521991 /DNA_START=376 /DNA_END=828 /DNA_ORIENTATION=+
MDDFAMFEDVQRKLTTAGGQAVWHSKHARIREEGLTAKLMTSWTLLGYGHEHVMELNMSHNKRLDVLIYDSVPVEAKKAGNISTLKASLEKLRMFSHVVVVVYASEVDDLDQVMSEARRQISEEILARTNTPGCTELTCQALLLYMSNFV